MSHQLRLKLFKKGQPFQSLTDSLVQSADCTIVTERNEAAGTELGSPEY